MASYNATLETGDVLLFKRTGPVGWAITLVTSGDRCHAEIVVNGWDRHWSIGANAEGVTMRPVSSLLRTGSVLRVRRIPPEHTPPDGWQQALADAAIDIVGVGGYDYATLLSNLYTELVGAPPGVDPAGIPDRLICSQLCSLLLRRFAKFDPCPQCIDRWTTPDDLDRKSLLVTVRDDLKVTGSDNP